MSKNNPFSVDICAHYNHHTLRSDQIREDEDKIPQHEIDEGNQIIFPGSLNWIFCRSERLRSTDNTLFPMDTKKSKDLFELEENGH